jgi:chromosome segregation ATPase
LHALSDKADGDSLDKQKHRPSPLDLQTIAKTSVHHPMATSQNAVLAELAEEVRVQRARAEQLEKERDDAEQGEQARSLHVAMETRVLHAKLKNAFERIAASRKTAATMRENLTAHQGALSACESSVEELSTELQDAKDEVTDLTEQLASCEDKVLSAATAACESSEAAEQTEQKLQQAEARAALLAERGTDLQTQLGDAQTRSSGSAESAAAAKAALDKAEDRHKAAAIRVRELEAESTTEQAWSDAIQTAREEMKQAEDHEASLIQSLSKEKTRRIVVETQVPLVLSLNFTRPHFFSLCRLIARVPIW